MADETFRTELIIDSAPALENAKQIGDALGGVATKTETATTAVDAFGVSVDRASTMVEVAASTVRQQNRALDDFRKSTDDVYRAELQLEKGVRSLDLAQQALARDMRDGKLTAAEYERQMATLAGRQGELRLAAQQLQSGQISVNQSYEALQSPAQRAAAAMRDMEREQTALSASARQYIANVDPLAAAQTRYADQISEADRLLKAGLITQEQYSTGLRMAQQDMQRVEGSARALGDGYRFTYTEQQILRSGVINTVQSLAAGMPVWTTLQTQLFQTAPAFPALTKSIGLSTSALIGIAAPITVAVALLAGLAYQAISTASETKQLSVALEYSGNASQTSVSQLRGYVRELRNAGVAMQEAIKAGQELGRMQGISGSTRASIASILPDYAAGTGKDINASLADMTSLATGGYAALQKLDDQFNFLTADERKQILAMYDHGEASRALALEIDALSKKYQDANEKSMTPLSRTLIGLRNGWTDFMDAILGSDVVMAGLQNLSNNLQGIADLVNGTHNAPASPKALWLSGSDDAQSARMGQLQREIDILQNDKSSRPWVDNDALLRQKQAELAALRAPVPATVLTVGPGSAHGGGIDNTSAIGVKFINDETAAYQQQMSIITANGAARDILSAKMAAEAKVRDMAIPLSEKEAYVAQQVSLAKARQAQSVNDNMLAMSAEVRSALDVAAAYRVSTAAGVEAEARAQAHAEALKNYAVNEDALTRAIRDRQAAQGLVDDAKTLQGLDTQITATTALTAAQMESARAVEEVQRQNDVAKFSETALAAATDATRAQVEKDILAYDSKTRAILALNDAAQSQIEIATAQRALEQAQDQTAVALALTPEAQRAAEAQIAREQRIYDLKKEYGSLDDANARKLLEIYDTTANISEANARISELKDMAKGYADDIKQYLLDGFTGVYDNGKSMFQNLWDGALSGAKRFLINLALTFAEKALILPIVYEVVGTAGQATGVFGGSGSSYGGGIGGVMNGLSSLGSGILNNGLYSQTLAGYGTSFATSQLGEALGLSTAVSGIRGGSFGAGLGAAEGGVASSGGRIISGAGTSFSDALGNMGYGAIGSLAGSLLGLSSGNQWADAGLSTAGSLAGSMAGTGIASALGMGAAAGSWAGPVGAAAGALIALAAGSLFGGKTSVGPAMGMSLDASGGLAMSRTDNGANAADAKSFGDSVSATAQLVLAATGGQFANAGLVQTARNGYEVYTNGGRQDTGSDLVAAMKDLMLGGIKGGDEDILSVIKRSDATSVEQLVSDAQLAAWIKTAKAANDNLNPIGDALKAQIDGITATYGSQITRAQQLGLSYTELADARDKEIASAKAAITAQQDSILADWRQLGTQFFSEQLNPLQTFKDSLNMGPSSTLSPLDQYSYAKSQFQSAESNADMLTSDQLVSAAQNFISAARSYDASGTLYKDAVMEANALIGDRMTYLQNAQTDAMRDMATTFTVSIQDQTKALVDQFKTLSDQFNALTKAIKSAI